jgi:hypothetical protein
MPGMNTKTRLQISYVALGVSLVVATVLMAAHFAHIAFVGWGGQVLTVASLLWAPAFYAVAFYRRQLARERGDEPSF